MSLADLLRSLRERWISVVAVLTVAIGCALVVTTLSPREYESGITLYISSQNSTADNPTGAYQGGLLSEQRVKSYSQLVDSPRVTRPVIDQLHLPVTAEELAERISATAQSDSVLLNISVSDSSPQGAQDIANAVGPVFTQLVSELERPVDSTRPPAIAARIVEPAEVGVQTSPDVALNLIVGALLGLLGGCGLALLKSRLDNTVKSESMLAHLAESPGLGASLYNAEVENSPVVVGGNSQSVDAEAIKQVRTNLQFVNVDKPHKVVVISSSVPGEGKSTFACNLAVATASAGVRVLLVEGDLRRPRVADYLGLERSVGLTSVLVGRIALGDALQRYRGSLDFLASGPLPPNPSELLGSLQIARTLQELGAGYDLILIDAPPLLPVSDAAALTAICDGLILIGRYGKVTADQVRAAAALVRSASGNVIGTVLTAIPSKARKKYGGYAGYYAQSGDDSDRRSEKDINATQNLNIRREMKKAATRKQIDDESARKMSASTRGRHS